MIPCASPAHDCDTDGASSQDLLVWHTRYDGLVHIARVGDRQVAGVSGPWSGRFALTWWHQPPALRQLQLFETRHAARCEVETWVRRRYGDAAVPSPLALKPASESGLLQHLKRWVPGLGRLQSAHDKRANIEHLKRLRDDYDLELSGLHFAARDEAAPHS